MKISQFFALAFFVFFVRFADCENNRRLGKLENQSWTNHHLLGKNDYPYLPSNDYPDFSAVGALISNEGILGTATLVAPDMIITAAHVIKNRTNDPLPLGKEWQFYLHHDFDLASEENIYSVQYFNIHPEWINRQKKKPPLGDGDKLGVDLALAKLERPVLGVQPFRLPGIESLVTNQKIYIAGYGNLIEGENGLSDPLNSRRMAGENVLDRVVKELKIEDNSVSSNGGLLAFDFDSPSNGHNQLGQDTGKIDYLTTGSSESSPLNFEVSTAEGDSGGPLIAFQANIWRIFGTVSYGTSDSTYGDVTILTRLNNHLQWIQDKLPVWPSEKIINDQGWRESEWFGYFLPFPTGWNFHSRLGWFWSIPKNDNDVWAYFKHLGWLWLSRSFFPYMYSYNKKNWYYVDLANADQTRWFIFDFKTSSWKTADL